MNRFNKNIIFILLFIFSFALSAFLNRAKIDIPYFGGLYEKTYIDVTFKKEKTKVYFDNIEAKENIKIDNNHYLFYIPKYIKIKNINFENESSISSYHSYVGNKIIYVKKINNEKQIHKKALIILLSFFYNWNFYIISYIFLFLFLYNFKEKIDTKKTFIVILFLALIFRLCQINSIPFWDDEIYTLSSTASYSPLKALFLDPGNPPLYFILFKIYRTIVQKEEFLRFSSVLIGLFSNICFYIYLKNNLNKNKALLGFFIVAINIPLIYLSQELRCYILLIALAIVNSTLLFKFGQKNKFLYLLSSVLILYTHFYSAFIVFWNFLFGIYLFLKNQKKLLSFLTINFITFLIYIPLIFLKQSSIHSSFNSWLKPPDLNDFALTIQTVCAKGIIPFIFLGVLIYVYIKTPKKREKLFVFYNILTIIFTIFASSVFSYTIKPIFCYRYFYILYPYYFAIVSVIVYYFWKRKKIVLSVIFLIIFTIYSRINYQNLFCNHNLYLNFIRHDIDYKKTNYVFMTDTVKNYKEFKIKGANIIYLPVNSGINEIDIEKYHLKKPCVFYVLNLYLDNKTLQKTKINLYKTPLGVFLKGEYN